MNLMSRIFSGSRIKTPDVLQMEAAECGAASLAIILGFYGRFESLETLREDCGVTRNGSRASHILKAARKYGMKACGYQIPCSELLKYRRPVIVFWNFEHYLVYEGCSADHSRIYLNDPAEGHRIVDLATFEGSYTGVALDFEPGEEFRQNRRNHGVRVSLQRIMAGIRDPVFNLIWGGILFSVMGAVVPVLFQIFVDSVLIDGDDWMVSLIAVFFCCMAFLTVIRIIQSLILRKISLFLNVNRTVSLFRHLFGLPSWFFSKRNSGDLQHRLFITGELGYDFVLVFSDCVTRMVAIVLYGGMMLFYCPWMMLAAVLLTLCQCLFLFTVSERRTALEQSIQDLRTKMLDSVISGVDNFESVKTAGRENFIFRSWSDSAASYNLKQISFGLLSFFFHRVSSALGFLVSIVLFCLGIRFVMQGHMTMGELFAFILIAGLFTDPCLHFMESIARFRSLQSQSARIDDISRCPPDDIFSKDPETQRSVETNAVLDLREISFSYGCYDEPVLRNVSLTVRPGKKVAVVGTSGSGKTTLAKIAAGLLKPASGDVLVNGVPIGKYTADEFHRIVGMVDQSSLLLSGTVGENLSMFSPVIDPRSVKNAIHDAHIETELLKRGNPVNISVMENGSNFSGGQCQRMEIARVLTRNTPVVILDEATSALDTITESRIDSSLTRRGVSMLVIAHRLSTVRNADEIIVLDQGRVVERGTFSELLSLNGHFKKMMTLENTGDD